MEDTGYQEAAKEWAAMASGRKMELPPDTGYTPLPLPPKELMEPSGVGQSPSDMPPVAPAINEAMGALGVAKLRVKEDKQVVTSISTGERSYAEFHAEWTKAKEVKKNGPGEIVMGKKISRSDAAKVHRKATQALKQQFSVFEVARLLKDSRLSLEAYFSTLVSLRDDPCVAAKDRMAAADKIVASLMQVLKANDESEDELPVEIGSDLATSRSLMQVIVNGQGETEKVQAPPLPRLLEAKVVEAHDVSDPNDHAS